MWLDTPAFLPWQTTWFSCSCNGSRKLQAAETPEHEALGAAAIAQSKANAAAWKDGKL